MVELPFLTLEQAYLRACANHANLDRATFLNELRSHHAIGALKITGMPYTWVRLPPPSPGTCASASATPPTLGMRQEIPPEQAASMYPSFDKGGIYTDGILRLSNRPSFRWNDIVLATADIDRLWPLKPIGVDLHGLIRAEIKHNGRAISQNRAEKIARQNGAKENREKIRETLKAIQGPQKSGPKGPRKNRAAPPA